MFLEGYLLLKNVATEYVETFAGLGVVWSPQEPTTHFTPQRCKI